MSKETILTFGSGGHSTEMLSLIKNGKLADKDLHPTCIVTDDDQLICDKLDSTFGEKEYNLIKLTRGRRVGQSYLTSIVTVIISLLQAIKIIIHRKPQMLITNGPAISVIICLAVRMIQYSTLGLLFKCDIIYVESFCRTKSLSLSGKIIYLLRLANEFYVQWPSLQKIYPRSRYVGLLV